MKRVICVLGVIALFVPAIIGAVDIANTPIAQSRHNLASWSPYTTRATTETKICNFCHTVHSALVEPLWGHNLSSATYVLYSSATLKSPKTNQPDSGSRLCLSCHDGTVALGATVRGNIEMQGNIDGSGKLIGTNLYGTNLRTPANVNHPAHPISIAVNAELVTAKSADANYKLQNFNTNICGSGKPGMDPICVSGQPVYPLMPTKYTYGAGTQYYVGVQCATCHDPHDGRNRKFMREPMSFTNWSCSHTGPGNTTLHNMCKHCHRS